MLQHLETVESVCVQVNCELLGFEQGNDSVVVTVRDLETGVGREVEAKFLVGCDGGRSLVRDAIGARLEGTFGMSRNYNVVFRAGPGRSSWSGPDHHVLANQRRRPSHIGPMDSGDRWFFMPTGLSPDVPAGAAARERVGKRINAEKLSEFYTLGTILGNRYTDSPVIQPVARKPGAPRDFLNYVPSSAPGGRAPGAWLHDGSSLFDHFGEGFTLLALPSACEESIEAAGCDAARLGVPLKVVRSGNPAVACLYLRRLTLIRPVQHIAWTGDV